ncbi:ABC transporter permease [Ensifer sp. ENS12]|uniref:ABC transporter permease n=1 Tax=Ensifer sp. ENS12 TaxID=2854774 RepID=UPI001C468BCF|nr:ABC transporter permease subunit [Ensifer sp. ENS12]MBV7518982.1 ABC transporter permease subunit [Ensifer sp. ENS12]
MKGPGPLLTVVATLIFLVVLSPIAVVCILTFSADHFMAFPPSGYSLRSFRELPANEPLLTSLWLSLKIAPMVTLLSLLIGTSAALVLEKLNFLGRDALLTFFLAPLLLPALVLGLALLNLLTSVRLSGTIPALVLGHLIVTVPFVIRQMSSAFSALPKEVEVAAATLGAKPSRVVLRITLPLVMPSLIASAALSFLLCFDKAVISMFLVGAQATALPVEMMNYGHGRTDPFIAALSPLVIVGTLSIVLLVERLVGLARAVGTGGA